MAQERALKAQKTDFLMVTLEISWGYQRRNTVGWIHVLGDASLLCWALVLFSVKALSYSLLLI